MIYSKVHFPVETSLRWSGMESPGSPNSHQWHTVISSYPHQCGVPRTTMGPLRAVTKPVQGWGNLHNLIGVFQQYPEAPRQQRPSRAPKYPRGTSSREPKSNKRLNFYFHESPWRTQTDATDAMARPHEVVKSLTLKSHQSN